MVYGTQITSYWGESKPTSTGGGTLYQRRMAKIGFLMISTKVDKSWFAKGYHNLS